MIKIYRYDNVNKKNQIIRILADVGLVGLAVFYWLLFRMLSILIKVKKHVSDDEMKIFVCAAIGMWFFYTFLCPLYTLAWRFDAPSYIFFFYSAMVYKFYKHGINKYHVTVRKFICNENIINK